MDKRELEKIVYDADWKRLHNVIRNESDTHVRSTIDKLIDVFADIRMNLYTRIVPKWKVNNFLKEIHLLLMFYDGEYIESKCIENTNHLTRYVVEKILLVSDEELEDAMQTLMRGEMWRKGKIEFLYERKNIYSA